MRLNGGRSDAIDLPETETETKQRGGKVKDRRGKKE